MQLLTLNPAAISRTPSQALDPSSSSRLLPSPQVILIFFNPFFVLLTLVCYITRGIDVSAPNSFDRF